MFDDPIVNEVRQIRDELARRFNYDVEAIVADLMARQGEICAGHPLVHRSARKPMYDAETHEPCQVRETGTPPTKG